MEKSQRLYDINNFIEMAPLKEPFPSYEMNIDNPSPGPSAVKDTKLVTI